MLNFKKILVTPEMANEFLSKNTSNRRLKIPVVAKYAKDMVAGRWKEDTAELIKICKSGRVLDGQHRLMAVAKSGVSINFHFAFDVEDNVFDVLDTGTTRNASDVFKIHGVKHDNMLPSIISMYNFLSKGTRTGKEHNERMINSVLLNQYLLDEVFWQRIARKSSIWYEEFAKILSPSVWGGFYAFLYSKDEERSYDFLCQLATGMKVTNDVIYLLRNKLIQDKTSSKKMPQPLKAIMIIKAWNVFITGSTAKRLTFDSDREEFPIAISPNSK